jgi:hypothetical protein
LRFDTGMNPSRSFRRAALIAAVLAPFAAVAPVASAAVPVIGAPGQQALFPGVVRAHYAWRSWQGVFAGGSYWSENLDRLTWPDASLRTVGALDGVSGGPYWTRETAIDPWGGTVDQRDVDHQVNRGWVLAAGNREWTLRGSTEFYPTERDQLVSWDASGRERSTRLFPEPLDPQVIVPTSRGLRVVVQTRRTIRLVDRNLRTTARFRLPRAAGSTPSVSVGGAAPLTDGSVIASIAVEGKSRYPGRLVQLRPGRSARVLWTGEWVGRLHRAAAGVVGFAGGAEGGVVAIDDRGHVRSRRWNRLGLPIATRHCEVRGSVAGGALVATSGRVVAALVCPSAPGAVVQVDAKARVRTAYSLADAGVAQPVAAEWLLVASSAPMADGSLPFPDRVQPPEGETSGWSTWLPSDSVAPGRGQVSVRLARGASTGRDAYVQITCRAPYGQLCSGVAELRAGGTVVGSTRYSLPARPGAAAAKDRLPVTLSTPVAAVDLQVTTAPLPPRPLLSPARPAWDASIPF